MHSSNIETFSWPSSLCQNRYPIVEWPSAKHHRTFSSCILPRRRQIELLRQFPEGLFDHVVAIGSCLLTLDNTCDHVIVVFQCRSISVTNRNRNEISRHCGLQLWSCFGNRSPQSSMVFLLGLHRFCHVLVNSSHDSNPRGCAVLKQRFDQNFNTVSIFMTTNFLCPRLDRSSYS